MPSIQYEDLLSDVKGKEDDENKAANSIGAPLKFSEISFVFCHKDQRDQHLGEDADKVKYIKVPKSMGKKRSHSKEERSVTEKKRKLREHSSLSDSENESQEQKVKEKHRSRHKHRFKSKHKKKKRKVISDSSSRSGTSDDESSSSSFAEKKRKKKHKKEKHKKSRRKNSKTGKEVESSDGESICIGPLPPEIINEKAKSMAPLTKEEWEKRQSVVRRVYDEETGRHRLIKGDGEVLEEIVSRDRHKEINRQATAGDGSFFQNKIQNKLKNV